MEQCNFGFFFFFILIFCRLVRKLCKLWKMILLLELKGLEEREDQVTKPFWGLVSHIKCFNEASVKQVKRTELLILKCNEGKKRNKGWFMTQDSLAFSRCRLPNRMMEQSTEDITFDTSFCRVRALPPTMWNIH